MARRLQFFKLRSKVFGIGIQIRSLMIMLSALRSLIFWLTFMISGMLVQATFLGQWILNGIGSGNSHRLAQRMRLYWSSFNLWLFFGIPKLRTLRFRSEHLPPQFILVCNHRCNLDPLFVFVIGRPLLFLSKRSVLNVPVVGWWMRLCGDVPVDRSSKESRAGSLSLMRERLQRGDSLLVYPEGTRQSHPDIALGPFKDGAFQMASELKVPIVLLALHRTDKIWPKGSLLLRSNHLQYDFSEPLEVHGKTAEELKLQSFEKMTEMLHTLKEQSPH
jgi:1-acyl-sn-glycerol-3-phosphate acyltransferase